MVAAVCAALSVWCAASALRRSPRTVLPVELARLSTLDGRDAKHHTATSRPLPLRLAEPLMAPLTGRVRARWAGVSSDDLRRAGIDPARFSVEDLVAVKILAACLSAAMVLGIGLILPGIGIFAPALAFVGFVAPSVIVRRRRAARVRQILRELPDLVGLLKAFITAGITLEQALHLISEQQAQSSKNLLAVEIRHALSDYGLGMSIDSALGMMAERTGITELETLASALAQGKRQGAGMERILRDQEELVRMQQRNRATAEASRVGTRLVGVLVAVYLPEFMVLIMVPLFYGIFLRAFS